jgi:biotin carboxyl carrier protein
MATVARRLASWAERQRRAWAERAGAVRADRSAPHLPRRVGAATLLAAGGLTVAAVLWTTLAPTRGARPHPPAAASPAAAPAGPGPSQRPASTAQRTTAVASFLGTGSAPSVSPTPPPVVPSATAGSAPAAGAPGPSANGGGPAPATAADRRTDDTSTVAGGAGRPTPSTERSGSPTEGQTGSGSVVQAVPAGAAAPPPLVPPVAGEVLLRFGWAYSPVFGDWQEHTGLDLAARPGTPVVSPGDGVVAAVRSDALWGVVVSIVLDHGYSTNVSPLAGVRVQVGQTVRAGQPLGVVAASPPAEANLPPHVFWQLFQGTRPVDPSVG